MKGRNEASLTRRGLLLASAALFAGFTRAPRPQARVFIGSYTPSRGIHTFTIDTTTGVCTEPSLAVETANPGNLILHPNGRFLYAAAGRDTLVEGSNPISAFAVEGDKLRLLNSVAPGMTVPTHGAVDRGGRCLLTTGYGSGQTAVFRLRPDGSIAERTAFLTSPGLSQGQDKAKPHTVALSSNERFAVVAEMATDQCVVYRFDPEAGSLTLHQVVKNAPKSGPRHFEFHPSYRFAYSSNEYGSSASAYAWSDDEGRLTLLDTVPTTPSDFSGKNDPSEIVVHPNGRFVYVSNRGHDSLAIFSVDSEGALKIAGYVSTRGKSPWCFDIEPGGRWLVASNQQSGNIVIFGIDTATGALTPTGQEFRIPSPTCVRFAG
jgi:6-phosphogluconolactonase